MNNKEYHVNYESGESRYGGGQGVDFMMVVEAVPATGEHGKTRTCIVKSKLKTLILMNTGKRQAKLMTNTIQN